MVQVSKRLVDNDIYERIFEVFWQSTVEIRDHKQAQNFFNDLLTPTEKVMLAKRLSIAIMLIKDFNYREIQDTLKVSSATIKSVNLWLKYGGSGCRGILDKIILNESWQDFWDRLKSSVGNVLPPGRGSNWSQTKKESYLKLRKDRYKRRTL